MEENKESHEPFIGSAEKLAQIVDKLDRDFMQRRSWWYSLSHGLLQGVGIALGATVLFVIIFYGLMALENVPGFGDFASKITDQIFINRELIK